MVKRIIISLIQLPIRMDQLRRRTGYHATYGGEAKKILDDLQSRNERMFLITVLFLNAAKTKQVRAWTVYSASLQPQVTL